MKQREEHGVGIGNASILLIFIVLTLTIFSVLTLLSAKSEAETAERSAKAVQSYYAADREACIKLESVREAIDAAFSVDDLCEALRSMGCTVAENAEGLTISYRTEVDANRRIYSELRYENGKLTETAWKTEGMGQLEIDDGIDVWDGSDLPIC